MSEAVRQGNELNLRGQKQNNQGDQPWTVVLNRNRWRLKTLGGGVAKGIGCGRREEELKRLEDFVTIFVDNLPVSMTKS